MTSLKPTTTGRRTSADGADKTMQGACSSAAREGHAGEQGAQAKQHADAVALASLQRGRSSVKPMQEQSTHMQALGVSSGPQRAGACRQHAASRGYGCLLYTSPSPRD